MVGGGGITTAMESFAREQARIHGPNPELTEEEIATELLEPVTKKDLKKLEDILTSKFCLMLCVFTIVQTFLLWIVFGAHHETTALFLKH